MIMYHTWHLNESHRGYTTGCADTNFTSEKAIEEHTRALYCFCTVLRTKEQLTDKRACQISRGAVFAYSVQETVCFVCGTDQCTFECIKTAGLTYIHYVQNNIIDDKLREVELVGTQEYCLMQNIADKEQYRKAIHYLITF